MSMKDQESRLAMALLLAIAGLGGCSSAAATPTTHKDGGSDGSSSYAGGSSGGLGLLGGGSSGGGDDSGAAASDDASSSGGDSAASGDAGDASSDAAPGSSSSEGGAATTSCVTPDGGHACDPGRVTGGPTSCNTASQFCCVGGGSGASSDVCSPFNGASCPSSALTVACDETADCANSVCCEENVGAGMQGPSQCMTACPSGWFRLCKSDRECGDADGGSLAQCILPGLHTDSPGCSAAGARSRSKPAPFRRLSATSVTTVRCRGASRSERGLPSPRGCSVGTPQRRLGPWRNR